MKHDIPHDPAARDRLDRAESALAAGLLDDALASAQESLRLNPDNAEARLLEARIRLRRCEPKLALTALDNRDRVDPDDKSTQRPDVMLVRATALAGAGRSDLAVALMERLAHEFADDAGVLRALAGLQANDDRPQDAAQTLQRLC